MKNKTDFLAFFAETHAKIKGIQKAYGFTGEYRKKGSYIKYDKFLTPPVDVLSSNPTLLSRIGSKAVFSLKKQSELLGPQEYFGIYPQAFNFDYDNCKPMGNDEHSINILRCLYDLSFKYKDDELLKKCKALIIGYAKYFQLKYRGLKIRDLLWYTDLFFHIHSDMKQKQRFINEVAQDFSRIELEDLPVGLELEVLKEFIYLCPEHTTIKDKIMNFYKDYFARLNNPDVLETAAWIIKTFCDIHPFGDGNGRVSRTLAFDLIKDQMGVEFTEDEITSFSKDKEYSYATSRMNYMEETKAIDQLKTWFKSVILKKNPQTKFYTKTLHLAYIYYQI